MATYTRDALSPIAAPLPLRNGGCTAVLSNRIVKGAMTECLADPATHDPNLQHVALYRRWAQETRAGGPITGNVQVGRAAATVCFVFSHSFSNNSGATTQHSCFAWNRCCFRARGRGCESVRL